MGKFADWFYGTEGGPQSSSSITPEVRLDEPVLPTPNVDEALIIPRRGDWEYGVSSGEALGMIAVYRAVNLIATAGIQLSFDAYRDDSRVEPKPLILRRLDADEPFHVTLEKLYNSLALNGNFFARVFRDNQGRVTGARVLNPNDVIVQTDTEGNVTGYKYSRRDQPFTKSEVIHRSLARVPGDPRGRGPIQAAQAELRGAIDARDYSANWFQDAGVPTGILSAKMNLNAEQAATAKAQWIASQGGQRGPAVLGNDFSWQSVYLSPEDAQWVAVRQFNTTDIARLFGIPAGLMLAAVEGTSQTYTNQQQAWVEFQRFTLARYVIEVESFFTELLPRGTEAKANYEALLAPDTTTRYAAHAVALTNGWVSVNEVRAIEGLEPAPDQDWKTAEEKVAEQQAMTAAQAPEEDPKEASDE